MSVHLAYAIGLYFGLGLWLWSSMRKQPSMRGVFVFLLCVLLWPIPVVVGTRSFLRKRRKPKGVYM